MGEGILTEVSESLSRLGFTPSYEPSLKNSLSDLKQFSSLVSWLTKELHILTHGAVDKVAPLEDATSPESFQIELSSALRALHCPYKVLMQGDFADRLETDEKKLLLLDFLSTEAQAARMSYVDKKQKRMRLDVPGSSPEARDAALLLQSLKIARTPTISSVGQFFVQVEKRIAELKPPKQKALLDQSLNPKQWALLEQAYHRLLKDFTARRMMLIKRVDVTVQSFRWSSRMKDKQNDLTQVYMPIRQELSVEPTVQLGDVLAAREDVAIQEKTSCQSVRRNTQTEITKVIIGPVPDRGGRSAEMQPPPPEMPSWAKRQEPPRGGGRGGRGFHQSGGPPQGGGYNQGGRGGGGDRSYNQNVGNSGYGYEGSRPGYGHDDRYGEGHHQGGRNGGYKQAGGRGQYDQGGYQGGGGGGGQYRDDRRDYDPGRIQGSGWDDSRRGGGRGRGHRGGYRGGGNRGRY